MKTKTYTLKLLLLAAAYIGLVAGCLPNNNRPTNSSKPESTLPLKPENYPIQKLTDNIWVAGAISGVSYREARNLRPLLPTLIKMAEDQAKRESREIISTAPISLGDAGITGFVVTTKALPTQ